MVCVCACVSLFAGVCACVLVRWWLDGLTHCLFVRCCCVVCLLVCVFV